MSNVLSSALMLFLIIVLGQVLKLVGVFKQEDFRLLSKIVMNITLPCAVINNVSAMDFDRAFLVLILFGLAPNLVLMGIGLITSRKRSGKETAFSMLNLCGFNVGCFAMPFLQTFSGPTAVVSACFFDAGNCMISMGVNFGAADAIASGKRQKLKPFLINFVKKIFSSGAFVAYLLVFSYVSLGFQFHGKVLEFTSIVGAGNVFLSMLMLGIGMDLGLNLDKVKRIGGLLAIRFGMAAVFAVLLYILPTFSLEIRKTLMICIFAPVSSLAPVLTERCGGDPQLSATLNSCSILLSLVFMTGIALVV